MSIWARLLSVIGLRPISAPRKYKVSESMQVTLTTLALHDGTPEDDLIQDLLNAGLTQYYSSDVLLRKRETLSSRERNVATVACLDILKNRSLCIPDRKVRYSGNSYMALL